MFCFLLIDTQRLNIGQAKTPIFFLIWCGVGTKPVQKLYKSRAKYRISCQQLLLLLSARFHTGRWQATSSNAENTYAMALCIESTREAKKFIGCRNDLDSFSRVSTSIIFASFESRTENHTKVVRKSHETCTKVAQKSHETRANVARKSHESLLL